MLGLVHDGGELGHFRPDLVGDGAPLHAGRFRRLLGEGGGDEGGGHTLALLPAWASTLRMKWTRQRCQVAHSTLETAALMPSWASEIDELDAAVAAAGELAQELGPDRLGLGSADLHAQNLAPAVGIDADRDDDRDGDDAATAADLQVGGVDPEVGPVTLDGPLEERLHPAVDLLAQPAIPGSSRRRSKATLIYRKTGNLRAVQLLLGHSKLESTVRYLGIEVDDALAIAEQVEV